MIIRLIILLLMYRGSVLLAAEAPDLPVPKLDRSGAPDQRFIKRHQEFVATAMKGGYDLVLVGDYLTDDFRGNAKNGVAMIYQKSFSAYRPINLGQGGDYTQHVLWRLQNGELEGYVPRVMMLMIGGTNGSNGDAPERIVAGVKAIIAYAQSHVPGFKVLLLPVLPWDRHPADHRTRHQAVNQLLPTLDDGGKSVLFIDIASAFLSADGTIPEDLMPDAAHLSDKGYQLWADSVAVALDRLMQGAPIER